MGNVCGSSYRESLVLKGGPTMVDVGSRFLSIFYS